MFGIFEVFADTIVICTLTALVILVSGVPVNYGAAAGAELTISGFTRISCPGPMAQIKMHFCTPIIFAAIPTHRS